VANQQKKRKENKIKNKIILEIDTALWIFSLLCTDDNYAKLGDEYK
jgi:hypothetical protein